jgi:hypothetical protein
MTEEEWVGSHEPEAMLAHLGAKAGARKARLFALACCRRISRLMVQEHARRAFQMAEAAVRGRLGPEEIAAEWQAAWDADGVLAATVSAPLPVIDASAAALYAIHPDYPRSAGMTCSNAVSAVVGEADEEGAPAERARTAERAAQAELLREIFGNPFRRVRIRREWLRASDRAVEKLARTIEETNFALLPILADALQDAGCRDASILEHCKREGGHVPGCWVVDLVLGRK